MSESQLNSRDITFRTVFHDVEGIKSYLRKLRHENERVMKNIEGVVSGAINDVLNDSEKLKVMISELVNDAMDPLQTAWVDTNFIAYISDSISDTTVSLISNRFIDIVSDNTEAFNAYISNNITSATVGALISPLKTEWVDTNFINYIASEFTEDNIKNMLGDYHLIKKYYTTLTENVNITADNPQAALKRFRILAYISGDNATDNLHYKYTSNAITEDAYAVTDGNLIPAVLTIADLTAGEGSFNVKFNNEDSNVDYKNYLGGTLWYGFTDLVDPNLLNAN